MDIDENRINNAVLALLLLGLYDGRRGWKSFDWDALDRLHAEGLISDPVGKAQSVMCPIQSNCRCEIYQSCGKSYGNGCKMKPSKLTTFTSAGRAACTFDKVSDVETIICSFKPALRDAPVRNS